MKTCFFIFTFLYATNTTTDSVNVSEVPTLNNEYGFIFSCLAGVILLAMTVLLKKKK